MLRNSVSFDSIQPFDRWGFKQNLDGDDEEAFLSMAKKMDRRSEQLKVNKQSYGRQARWFECEMLKISDFI